jgi:hypothetical protein
MVNPIKLRDGLIGLGAGGGLLAATEAEAGRSTSLSDALSYWKSLTKKKFKEEGETKVLLQQLKDMGVEVKKFDHEYGDGGNYGTLRAVAPNGDKLHSQIASSSTAEAKGQIRSQLRGLLETLDPSRQASDGSKNHKKWLGYTGGALTAGAAQASEGRQQSNPFDPYLNGTNDTLQNYMVQTKDNSYDGMTPKQEAYWREQNNNDIRDAMLGLGEGLLSAPVGVAEAFVGLPGDLIGLAKGSKAAYDAKEGEGWDAFEQGFNSRTYLPTTQDIQNVTNEYLPSWMQGGMGSQGRTAGEWLAPGGYVKLGKKLGLNRNNMTGMGLLGGGANIE